MFQGFLLYYSSLLIISHISRVLWVEWAKSVTSISGDLKGYSFFTVAVAFASENLYNDFIRYISLL